MVKITQPRRVAAVSMANRVAQELSLSSSRLSSNSIRRNHLPEHLHQVHDGWRSTPGTLFGFLAPQVSSHHRRRSARTEYEYGHLIGVPSMVPKLREEMWRGKRWYQGTFKVWPVLSILLNWHLRLVIMSATLRIIDMAENKTLFATPPPTINVPGFQHAVMIHFSRMIKPDYVAGATSKVIKIYNRLPPGGFLIFLTGAK